MTPEDKTRENRIRRAVSRRMLFLQKSRRRDERAPDFDRYMIVDPRTKSVVAGNNPVPYSMTLQDVENWLKG